MKSWMDGHAQEPALYWPFIVPRLFGRMMHLGPVIILEPDEPQMFVQVRQESPDIDNAALAEEL